MNASDQLKQVAIQATSEAAAQHGIPVNIPRKPPTVTITLEVPLSELDLSECLLDDEEVDLSDAMLGDLPIEEISDRDFDTVVEYLAETRRERPVD